jgi:hypothetical protein
MATAVASKIEAGNLRAAVRILCSDEKPAEYSDATFTALQDKHPSRPVDSRPAAAPLPDSLQMDAREVIRAIRSFPSGSAGGQDGLRPQHLRDLLGKGDGVDELAEAMTDFVNLLLKGKCPEEVRPYFFGGRLLALAKKDGGVRPIAVGLVWRRLAAKCANFHAVEATKDILYPQQLGVSVKGGAEGAIHAARGFLTDMGPNEAFIKLDFKNAFNCLRRDEMLAAVLEVVPEIYNFCYSSYAEPSSLWFGERVISSEVGPQQGDPLGPFVFSIALHRILRALKSVLVMGYLDDVSAGGDIDTLASDVQLVIDMAGKLGLTLNLDKCEIITTDPTCPLPSIFHRFKKVAIGDACLLGAPLFVGPAMDSSLESRCAELERAIDRFSLISSHDALVILKNAVGSGKLLYILRAAPCVGHPALERFDSLLRKALSVVTNSDIPEIGWIQASLPVASGGMGIRSVVLLAPSAFLASAAATLELQQSLRPGLQLVDRYVQDVEKVWCDRHAGVSPPLIRSKQQNWDSASVKLGMELCLSSAASARHLARLKACMAPHSGDWLNALPITSCGLRLDNDAIRVAVGLRLGLELCAPHVCPCGAQVDVDGWHSLSCKRSSGRSVRHNLLNDLIYRALLKASVPSAKEPLGLTRSDGKRPDGVTLIAWQKGKRLAWDVTVPDTLAPSYVSATSACAGAAAEAADIRKQAKYVAIGHSHVFCAIACETMGPINADGLEFLKELGNRLSQCTGDPREGSFLLQRISVLIQRGNSVAFTGSFIDHHIT